MADSLLDHSRDGYRLVERGELPCEICGEVHHCWRPDPPKSREWGSWAHPKDGHLYRRRSWESVARQIVDEYRVDLAMLGKG